MNLILQVVQTAGALEAAAARVFKPFDLSPAQFNVLNLLGFSLDGLRAGDLASELIVDPSNITRLLQRMKRAKLITTRPDPDDGRAMLVQLTPTGRERWKKAQRSYEAALRELEAKCGLNAAQVTLVDRFLATLRSGSHELHR